jgi:hypothetical protein
VSNYRVFDVGLQATVGAGSGQSDVRSTLAIPVIDEVRKLAWTASLVSFPVQVNVRSNLTLFLASLVFG